MAKNLGKTLVKNLTVTTVATVTAAICPPAAIPVALATRVLLNSSGGEDAQPSVDSHPSVHSDVFDSMFGQ